MFEMIDPYDESEAWQSFVPPVPPDDDGLVDADELLDADDVGDALLHDDCLDAMDSQLAAEALAEFEESLAERVDELDADRTLARAVGGRRRAEAALVEQLELAAHWADLHAVLTDPSASGRGRERLVRLGGDGSPEIAEFAPAELGGVLGMTDHAVTGLIGDALDLRHRFPLLWQAVHAGGVDVWIARRTVQEARPLSKEAAARVDARVAGIAGALTWRRLKPIVAAAILAADPPKALSDAERAAEQVGVILEPETQQGYQTLIINAAAGDITALHRALDLLARAAKTLGDTRTLEQRRAAAAGIIADPKAAQHLLARAEAVRQAQRDAAAAKRAGDRVVAEDMESTLPCRGAGNQRPFVFGTSILYYHVSQETMDAILNGQPFAGAGVVRMEDVGPVIAGQVKQWLGHSNVIVKPVINLAGIQPVDHYETPPAISEAIGLIRQADAWPSSTCLSRRQDNEHTVPYLPMDEGGPPGQTDPLKMSKMTRSHHRLKTFGGWTMRQLRPGAWLTRSPRGYHYLVDQLGTAPLGKL